MDSIQFAYNKQPSACLVLALRVCVCADIPLSPPDTATDKRTHKRKGKKESERKKKRALFLRICESD